MRLKYAIEILEQWLRNISEVIYNEKFTNNNFEYSENINIRAIQRKY